MNAFRSIRWRLQSWHGVMLALALAGFGYTAWRLEWENQLRRIDQELEERVSAVAGATLAVEDRPSPAPPPPDQVRRGEGPEDRPAPDDPRPRRPRQEPPPQFQVRPELSDLRADAPLPAREMRFSRAFRARRSTTSCGGLVARSA